MLSAAALWLCSCSKADVTDSTAFEIFYQGVFNVHPGESVSLTPSYIGEPPSDFRIYSISLDGKVYYSPKLDGELGEHSTFYLVPETGEFRLQDTGALAAGTYLVSLSCKSAGVSYNWDDAISIKVVGASKL